MNENYKTTPNKIINLNFIDPVNNIFSYFNYMIKVDHPTINEFVLLDLIIKQFYLFAEIKLIK